jgi:hypothetical protein
MKRSLLAIVLAMATLIAGSAIASAGNGAPQGPHDYQLNIIGTSEKNADMDGNNGHRIFVHLEGKSKINLVEGDDFAVIDANGTDREGATFQLPAPGYDAYIVGDPGDADVESGYSVFIRPLGKPGGWASITTCAELVDSTFAGLLPGPFVRTLMREGMEDGTECSVDQANTVMLYRDKGKSSFTNETAALTSVVFNVVYTDTSGAEQTVQIRVPLFDDIMDGEYWEYDNNGLRLAQVRFYDCSTNVETGASTC